MSTDSVIDEVRAVRDAIAREHDYDLASICRAIRERTRAAGIQTVTLPPRPAVLEDVAERVDEDEARV
jgi:rRNA-processing protein FCF1